MKLIVLGSGTFFVNKGQSASSFVLDTGKNKILVDCGPGTLVNLSKAGLSYKDIDYVFVTHLHPDHSSDLFPLFMNYNLHENFAPGELTKHPTFYGPPGLGKFMKDYAKLTEVYSMKEYKKIDFVDYKTVMNFEDFTVKTFRVVHEAFGFETKSYALRFEIGQKVITFSGDSSKCEGIKKASENSDLFLCDTSSPAGQPANKIHMNTTEIAQVAQASNVKTLVLVHLYPFFEKHDFVQEVKKVFKGEVVKAKDLDIIKI